MASNNDKELKCALIECRDYIQKVYEIVDRNSMMSIVSKRSIYYKNAKLLVSKANKILKISGNE